VSAEDHLRDPIADKRVQTALVMDGDEWEALARYAQHQVRAWDTIAENRRAMHESPERVEIALRFKARWKAKTRAYLACAALEEKHQTTYEETGVAE
jgi:hypothetical protein